MADTPNKIKNYALGSQGVVLDPHKLLPGVSSQALTRSQNFVHDPNAGFSGALRKRQGFEKFNSLAAGGVILGGIGMPIAGTGGATGGGAVIGTGDPSLGASGSVTSPGTGDGTGLPGATFDGGTLFSSASGISPLLGGATQFNSTGNGSPIFSGKRLIVVGRLGTDATVSNEGGSGWYISTKGLADVAIKQITPGPPIAVYSYPPVSPFLNAWGNPSCIDTINNTGLYYAAAYGDQVNGIDSATLPTSGPILGTTIRRTNGNTDDLAGSIGFNSFAAGAGLNSPLKGIRSMSVLVGGGGYVNGETVQVVGGTGAPATAQVVTTTGAISSFTNINPGSYSTLPSSPAFVLSSSGNQSATANLTAFTQASRNAIVAMHFGYDGFIYCCVKDKYTGQDTAGSFGRVVRFRPTTGETVEWNLSTTAPATSSFNRIPYACNYFDGRLYVGCFPNSIDDTGTQQLLSTDGTVATQDGAFGSSSNSHSFISCFCQYNGRLFMGTGDWQTTPSLATLWSRRPGNNFDSTGYSWSNVVIASGAVAANGNYWTSMVEFNGVLYAAWYSSTSAKIYKIVANNVGDPLSTSFTVTTSANIGTIGGSPLNLYVDDGVMYAIGVTDATPATNAWVTTDGATWTDKSASLPTLGTTSRVRPIFFGVSQ